MQSSFELDLALAASEHYPRAIESPYAIDEAQCRSLARQLVLDEQAESRDRATLENPRIPAGYTYFGQFVAHDISHSAEWTHGYHPKPMRTNLRTAGLDLDSLYGGGPHARPDLYSKRMPSRFIVRHLRDGDPDEHGRFRRSPTFDLIRNEQGLAIIPAPRNDHNVMVSQLHVAFQRAHNAIVDAMRHALGDREPVDHDALFLAARRCLRWHYHWAILDDYLPRLVDEATARSLDRSRPLTFSCYSAKEPDVARLPAEFVFAAFRFGHSQIRSHYRLNGQIREFPLVPRRPDVPSSVALLARDFLPPSWGIDWRAFFSFDDPLPFWPTLLPHIAEEFPQPSRKIDTRLTSHLGRLPNPACPLPELTLRMGRSAKLCGGHALADALSVPTSRRVPDQPIWTYILLEAETIEAGLRLGPVGSTVLADVLCSLIHGSPDAEEKNAAKAGRSEPARVTDLLLFPDRPPDVSMPLEWYRERARTPRE